jgi:sugar/nucleoside kinase (ribokinase family)
MTDLPKVVTMGELLIDFMASPRVKHIEDAEHFTPKAGGAPANVAVGLRRLGVPSGFIGMVGGDAFGRLLRKTLQDEGVDVRSLAKSTDQPTTLAFVALDEKGVPDFSFYRHPGADLSLRFSDVDLSVLTGARAFHFGSLSLVAPPAADTTRALLALANERGLFVTYDPNYRPALWPDEAIANQRMGEPLPQVHLLKVSHEELERLSGTSDIAKGCAKLAERGPSCIVVTRGGAGVSGWLRGDVIDVPVQPVEVKDTTGCGDALMAGTIAGLLRAYPNLSRDTTIEMEPFKQSLEFANCCAALTATRLGAIAALPTENEVRERWPELKLF